MAQSLLFFAGISNIGLPNSVASGVRYADKYVITSDRERIKRTVLPFYQAIGSVEGDYLVQEAPGMILRRDEWGGSSKDIRSTLESRIVEDLIVVQGLLLSLWLTKDNAATVDNAWIFAMDGSKFNVHTSSWAVRPSCSNGRFDQVEFSSEDFRIARMSTNLKFDTEGYISGKSHPTLLVASSQRFQRFLYLVGGARSTADVALKLALYCSALEAFVYNAHAEISHQV